MLFRAAVTFTFFSLPASTEVVTKTETTQKRQANKYASPSYFGIVDQMPPDRAALLDDLGFPWK